MQVLDVVRVLHGDVVGEMSDSTPSPPCSLDSPSQVWNSQSSTNILSGSLSSLSMVTRILKQLSRTFILHVGGTISKHRQMPLPPLALMWAPDVTEVPRD